MSENLEELIDPSEREALLRAEVLFAADTHEQDAETLDRPARAHAVDQYIQWTTDDEDMPLPTKRIRLVPSRPELSIGGVAEAYVNYPVERRSFVNAEHRSQLVFVRLVMTDGTTQRYLITPGRFLAFDGTELQVDPLLLELNGFSDQDPGVMFALTGSREGDEGDVESFRVADQLVFISKVLREYRLKSQSANLFPKAS